MPNLVRLGVIPQEVAFPPESRNMRVDAEFFKKAILKPMGWLLIMASCTAHAQIQLSIGSTNAASFEYSQQQLNVFPDIQNYSQENRGSYPSWRFYVDPLISPKFDADGEVLYERRVFKRSDPKGIPGGYRIVVTTRFSVPLQIRSEAQISAAAQALSAQYANGYNFKSSQVTTLPLIKLVLEMPDLAGSGCTVQNKTIPIGAIATPREVFVYIDCDDVVDYSGIKPPEIPRLPKADWLSKNFSALNSSVEITIEAKAVQIGFAEVQITEVRKTKLFAETSGDGSEVYVSRHDLRNLSDNIVKMTKVVDRGRKLTEEELKRCMFDKLQSLPLQSIELQQFSSEMLKRTYNAKDLDPNQITKTLDKKLDKNSSEESVKGNAEAGGGMLWGLVDGDVAISGETFKKSMSEHGVEVAFEGSKWVAKGMKLVHINASDFSQQISTACSFATFGESQKWTTSSRPVYLRKLKDGV